MESFNSGSGFNPKPSVSSDKLLEHARKKLDSGYVLLVDDDRSNANYFKPGAGYESCSYRIAPRLIQNGEVVDSGERDSVIVYRLSDSHRPPIV